MQRYWKFTNRFGGETRVVVRKLDDISYALLVMVKMPNKIHKINERIIDGSELMQLRKMLSKKPNLKTKSFEIGGVVYPDLRNEKPNVIYEQTELFDSQLDQDEKSRTVLELIPSLKITKTDPTSIPKDIIKIRSSNDAHDAFRTLFPSDQMNIREYMYVLYLNNANNIIGYQQLSKGGKTATILDNQLVLTTALNSLATAIIIAHNHPSGDPKPSNSDRMVTKELKEALPKIKVNLLDHLILTPDENRFLSFADEGLM